MTLTRPGATDAFRRFHMRTEFHAQSALYTISDYSLNGAGKGKLRSHHHSMITRTLSFPLLKWNPSGLMKSTRPRTLEGNSRIKYKFARMAKSFSAIELAHLYTAFWL